MVAVIVAATTQSSLAFLRPAELGDAGPTEAVSAGVVTGSLCAIFTFGGWLVGYLRWQSRQTVQARVDAALEARVNAVERRRLAESIQQQTERSWIAADMHGVVAHSWAVVAAQADGARYGLCEHPEQAEAALHTIAETARSAMTDVRLLLARLRDREPGQVALDVEAREDLIARMRDAGMTVRESISGGLPEDRLLP